MPDIPVIQRNSSARGQVPKQVNSLRFTLFYILKLQLGGGCWAWQKGLGVRVSWGQSFRRGGESGGEKALG